MDPLQSHRSRGYAFSAPSRVLTLGQQALCYHHRGTQRGVQAGGEHLGGSQAFPSIEAGVDRYQSGLGGRGL